MQLTSLKTPIINPGDDLLAVIDTALAYFFTDDLEQSVLVVTSKVVSLAEGNVVAKAGIDKKKLVQQEADWYTTAESSQYGVIVTIKDSILAVNAGVDESNVDGVYVMLPKDSYASAERIWKYVKDKFQLTSFGVVITDSTSMPLKWGVVGRSLAHCGFLALRDMRGQPDLFGRLLQMTQMNIVEGIAAAAVLEMGEGNHSTPLCLTKEITFIEFQDRPPTTEERASLKIEVEDDVYRPLITSDAWIKSSK